MSFINDKFSLCSKPITSSEGMGRFYKDVRTMTIDVASDRLTTTETSHAVLLFVNPMAMMTRGGQIQETELDADSRRVSSANLADLTVDVIPNQTVIRLACNAGDCWNFVSRIDKMARNSFQGDLDAKYIPFRDGHNVGRILNLRLCDLDTAARVRRAFEHLIVLSGGKTSPF